MAHSREQMIEWLLDQLGRVATGNVEGISIKELFERFDNAYTVEDGVKNGLWETLLSMDHVLLGNAKEKLAFKMLPLDTIFTLGLGNRQFKLRRAVPVPAKAAEDTIEVDNSPAPAPAPQPLVDAGVPESAKKRRGRPPKKKDDQPPIPKRQYRKKQAVDSPNHDTPIPSIETTTNESTDNAHIKRGSPGPVVVKLKAAVNSAVNAVHGGFRNLGRSRSNTAERNPQPDPTLEDTSGTRQSTRLRSHTPINYSLRRSRTPSVSGQDVGVRYASSESGNLQPVQEDAQANSNVTKDGEVSENQNQDVFDIPSIPHVTAPRSPSPETPVGESAEPSQQTPAKKTRGRARIQTPEDKFGESSIILRRDKLHNKDRRAGISGVYKDASESTQRRNQAQVTASAVLVFKSDKLKSPNWLEENRGSWQEPIAEAITAAIIEKEDNTQRPRRRRQESRKKDISVKGSDVNLESATAQNGAKTTKKRARDEESDNLGDASEREGELESSAKRQNTPDNNNRKAVDSVDGSAPSQPQAKRQKSNLLDETEALEEPLGEQNKEAPAVLAGPPAQAELQPSKEGAIPLTLPVQPQLKRRMSMTSNTQSQGEPARKRQRMNANDTPLPLASKGTSVATGTQQYRIPSIHPSFPQNASHKSPYQPQPTSFYPQEIRKPDQVSFNTHPPIIPSFFGSSNPAVASQAISTYDASPAGSGMPTMQSAIPRHLQGSRYTPSYRSPYASRDQQPKPPSYRSPYAPTTPTPAPVVEPPQVSNTQPSKAVLPPAIPAHPVELPLVSNSQPLEAVFPLSTPEPPVNLLQASNTQPLETVSPPSTPTVYPVSQSLPTTNFEIYDHQSAVFRPNPTSKPKATGPKKPTPVKRKRGRPKKVSLLSTDLDPESEAKGGELFDPLPVSSNKSPSASTRPLLSNTEASIPTSNEGERAIPKPTKFRSKAQRAAQEKVQVEAAYVTAGAVDVPDGVIRLAARYEQVVGNLLLSKDKHVLEFFGIDQHPPDLPMFVLEISKMNQNPITSVKGSDPMEIRVMSGVRGRPKAHCFQFSTSNEAYEAASHMRSKLVTAKITLELQTGGEYAGPIEAEYGILKPWKCEKCGARFKNDLGLKYHVTKSQTECNPNFDASQLTTRKKYASRQPKKGPKKPSRISFNTPESSSQQEPENVDMEVEGRQDLDEETDDSSSGDSNDSIFEWAQTVATNGIQAKKYDAEYTRDAAQGDAEDDAMPDVMSDAPATQIQGGPRKDKYRRMRFEGELLNDLAKEYNHPLADSILLTSFSRTSTFIPARDDKLFQKRVLAFVLGNGGMFPGDKNLWFAFVAAWLKHPDKSGDLPEFKFMARAVDQLVDAKKLLNFEMSCKPLGIVNVRGISRTFLVASDAMSNTSRIKRLKSRIRKAFPGYYLPSRYAPPEPWLSKMKTMLSNQGNWGPSNADIFDYEDEEEDQNEPVLEDEIELDEFSDEEEDEPHESLGRIRSRRRGSQVSLGDEMSGEDSDDRAPQRSRAKYYGVSNRRRNRANEPGIPLTREEKDRRARLAYVRLHAWAPVSSPMPNTTTGAWDQIKAIKRPSTFTEEERQRRARQALSRTHGWAPARTFLPNPKTGAWNQKPLTRKVQRKPRMPEPITFLQASSGAWSQRAFGHGVEPIFSRPARRTDGNRGQQTYLQRLDNGFRPVVVPKKGKPLHDFPSKKVLRRSRHSPLYGSDTDLQNSTEFDDRPRKRLRKVKATEDLYAVRVSKATGRPTRKYVKKQPYQRDSMRRGSTLSRVDSINYSSESSTEPANVRRSGRMPKRGVRSLNEIDLFDKFIEPKSVAKNVRANPGLKTLPDSFWSTDSGEGGFTRGYANVQFSEPKIASYDCDMADGSWFCQNLNILTPATFKVRWSEEDSFTVKTIPYHDLERDLEEAEVSELEQAQNWQQSDSLLKSNQERSQGIFETARQQIALLEDFAHVLPDPKEAPKTFGVEISSYGLRTRTKQGIKTQTTSAAFDTRLVFAVIVIRTLTGGLEGLIDWVILSKLFPDFSISFLTTSWRQLSKKYDSRVDELVGDFQTGFLEAYQKGDVPAIDFDNLMNYDWDALIDWTLATFSASLGSRSITLPSTRHELEREFTLSEPRDNDPQNWRATYFSHISPKAPIYKRLGVACSIPSSILIHEPDPTPYNSLEVAKSWVRAVALTPESEWSESSSLARTKLTSLGTPVIEKAVAELKEMKIIHHRSKGRVSPGRSYEVMDAFLAPLRKTILAEQFVQAVRFKEYLDEQFANGQERVRVQYMADGGVTMCTTQLQASRRVRLEGINVPMEKFGMCENGGYETKTIRKERFRFDIDMLPTPSYLLSDSLPFLDIPPPGPRENGELPLWLNVGGHVIQDLWRRAVVAIAQTVALRSSVTLEGLVKAFAPTFGKWEMSCLVEWGVQVGMFERVHPRIEGWTVGEWWWVIVGRLCEGGDEAVV